MSMWTRPDDEHHGYGENSIKVLGRLIKEGKNREEILSTLSSIASHIENRNVSFGAEQSQRDMEASKYRKLIESLG